MNEGSKTIRVSDSLHARIKAESREDETLSETLERLLGEPSLRELAGILSDEETEEFRAAIEASHSHHDVGKENLFGDTE